MAKENLENELRQKAEKLVSEGKTGHEISPADKDVLIHELEVHQIELELQNEELQRAQRELQVSRNLYADLFEFAPVGYFILDRHFLIESGNLTGSRLLDMERRRLSGKRFMSFVVRTDQDVLYRCFISQTNGGGKGCELRMQRRDGTQFYADLKVSEETTGAGVVKYRVAVVDITERKRLEDELSASRDDLEVRVQERSEQLRRMTGQLTLAEQRERQRLSQILHDGLQQILVGAKYRLAFLERDVDLHVAKNEVSELIDDAIETSRSLTAELSPPVLLQGNFIPALEWLARWMRDKQGLNVNLTAHENIRPLTNEAMLLLFQAVRELLFNVVKHAGIKTASVEVDQVDQQILLTVEDRGVGFDMSQLQSHGKGDESGGTGLLGIQERISYIGGRIEIDSAPGKGSRFRLIAPLSVFAAEAELETNEKPARVSVLISPELKSGASRAIRIMLVDDHLVMRQGLAGLLRSDPGFEIAGEASDGEAAVKLAREIRPDVILMDINMPGMDGIQATAIIHKEFPGIRIIGLSMFKEDTSKTAMCNVGATAYLTKSGPAEELMDVIRTCVR